MCFFLARPGREELIPVWGAEEFTLHFTLNVLFPFQLFPGCWGRRILMFGVHRTWPRLSLCRGGSGCAGMGNVPPNAPFVVSVQAQRGLCSPRPSQCSLCHLFHIRNGIFLLFSIPVHLIHILNHFSPLSAAAPEPLYDKFFIFITQVPPFPLLLSPSGNPLPNSGRSLRKQR